MSRTLSAAVLAAFLATPAAELAPSYSKGATIRMESESTEELVFDDVRVIVNGSEMEIPEEQKQIPEDQRTERKVVWVDRVVAVDGGRRTSVERAFETLDETSTGMKEEEKEGVLVGRTLKLRIDDDGELAVEVEGEDDVDDEYLERHRIEHLSDLYLPGKAVEIGDTWELSDEATALLAAGVPRLFELEDEEAEFAALNRDNSTIEAEVTYARDEERDGRKCAVLEVTYEVVASIDGFDAALLGFDGEAMGLGDVEVLADYEMEGEGHAQLWVALDGAHLVAEEDELMGSILVKFEIENQGMSFEIVTDMSLSIETTTTWSEGDGE